MIYGREMRRYQILPVAMRERTQIEEKLTEESPFDISDAEKQLLLEMARDIEVKSPLTQIIAILLSNSNRVPKTLMIRTFWIRTSNREMSCMRKLAKIRFMPIEGQ